MLDDESAMGTKPSRRRHKRVQRRSLPPTDIWDREQKDFVDPGVATITRKKKHKGLLFLQFMICLAIGLSVPYAVKWGYDRFYVNNTELALANLTFTTDGNLDQQRVIEECAITLGTSLARLDLQTLKDRITAIPQVESAKVEREFPDRLIIVVTERKPVAWLSCPVHQIRPLRKGGQLIDKHSIIFKCQELSQSLLQLPTIEANPGTEPIEGDLLNLEVVDSGLQLIEAAPMIEEQFGIKLVDIRPVGNWGLLCRYSNNLLATFDMIQLERCQQNFIEILETTQAKGLTLATVNLAPAKNIPVTFQSKNPAEKW